jgi:sec-independent protein translocase protein TatA
MFEGLFQPMHLLVILGIALLVFGPKKLPELGKGLGESIRGFKDALSSGAASTSQPAPPPAESKPPEQSQNPGPTP